MFVLCAGTLSGATITVTNLNDSGPGSLREAIVQANTDTGADEIVFGTGVNFPGTISLQTALPDITEDLTITGPVTDDLFIERDTTQPPFRLFTITAGTVALSHLWMGKGSVVGAAGTDAEGGGIHNMGTLTLQSCVIFDCTARGGDGDIADGGWAFGGGIFSGEGVTMHDVALVNCNAVGGDTAVAAAIGGDGLGGGVFCNAVFDSLVMLESTVSNCSARGGSAANGVAGVSAAGGVSGRTALIQDCGVSGCETTSGADPWDGGAVVVSVGSILRRTSITNCTGGAAVAVADVELENCTISSNQGEQFGGLRVDSVDTVLMRYCTVTLNTGTAAGGVQVVSGTFEVMGSIIAGNTGAAPDVEGQVTDLGNNLIGDATGSMGFTVSTLVGSQFNPVPAGLGPLQQFGLNALHMPIWGSYAIDGGGTGAPFDDQRRANRAFGGTPDIGAVEFIVNQRPAFPAGGTVTVKGDGKDRTISGWATNIMAGAPWESGQQLKFEISGSRFAFESGPTIDPLTGDLHFRPREGEDGVFFFDVTLVDDGGTANGGEDTSTTRQLVIDIERTKDSDDDLRCSAAPGTGVPLLLACAAAVALLWRRRRVQPRACGVAPGVL
jgi:hypothetical protein